VVGQNVSHYEITGKLGEGGMGVVYKARDTKLDRTVALKYLPKHVSADETEKKRFLNEAKAASALDHINICSIYSIEETSDGSLFIVMAYYEGMSLKEKIERGPLPVKDVVHYSIQIMTGLQRAHDKGIVHRDLKPANLFITTENQVKIIDFGLAKATQHPMLTKSGTTLGTVPYMSPEQARGEKVDHRTDIWSLGVVIYEMITGQRPFRSEYETALVYSIINEDPEPITGLRNDVPDDLVKFVDRCLEKKSADRYEQVGDILIQFHSLSRNLERGVSPETETVMPSIVVLPFVNMNKDTETEFLSDGVTEDIIIALSKLEELKVVDRNSAFRFKDKTPDIKEIGRQLRVGSILTGSVRRASNRLRINVQLSNVADGYEIWSERFDRVLEDIFDIQDEISRAVVDALKVKLFIHKKERLVKRHTTNIDAYNYYLKGRYHWNQRTLESIVKAKEYFEQALVEDPQYALAYSGVADCFGSLGLLGACSPAEVLQEGKAAALKAIEFDPALAEAHASLGFIEAQYNRNWDFADRKLQHALELDPGYANALHWRALQVLTATGRLEEAEVSARLARAKQPTTAAIDFDVGWVVFHMRKYDEAIAELLNTLELDRNLYYTHWLLGRTFLQKGEYEKAFSYFERVQLLPLGKGLMGYAYALSGQQEKSEKILNELLNDSRQEHIFAYQVALVYCAFGEVDKVFEWLNKAYEVHDPWLCYIKVAPEFEHLHSDPRWDDLMQRMGLSPYQTTHYSEGGSNL